VLLCLFLATLTILQIVWYDAEHKKRPGAENTAKKATKRVKIAHKGPSKVQKASKSKQSLPKPQGRESYLRTSQQANSFLQLLLDIKMSLMILEMLLHFLLLVRHQLSQYFQLSS
jgi:hypothetical protein